MINVREKLIMANCKLSEKSLNLCVVLVLGISLFCVSYSQDSELSIRNDLVAVPVTVFDRQGRLIGSLSEKDFEIYENGELQEIVKFESAREPITIVFVLDLSPSMIPYLNKMADYANTFIDGLQEEDCIGIYGFYDELQELLPIVKRSRITVPVKIYGKGARTALYKSIKSVIDRVNTIKQRKAVILFSDGKDTFGGVSSKDVLRKVSESDAAFYVLQFGDATISKNPYYDPGENAYPSGDTLTSSDNIISRRDLRILGPDTRQKKINEFMTQLAERTGGRYFRSAEIEDFQEAFNKILQDLSAKYYLYYYPDREPKRGEQRSIRIKVLKDGMVVTSRTSVVYK